MYVISCGEYINEASIVSAVVPKKARDSQFTASNGTRPISTDILVFCPDSA